MTRKPLRPGGGPLFVGYAAPTDGLKRTMMLGGLAAMAGAGLTGAAMAAFKMAPGPGVWDPGKVRTWRGLVVMDPYPMLRFVEADGSVRTALLGCPDKCGAPLEVAEFAGRMVDVRGSAATRGGHLMITAAAPFGWITAADGPAPPATPAAETLGALTLEGELMDAKCWLGAMRPGEGLTHKGCAELCVRSGLPLLFVTGGRETERRVFIALGPDGSILGADVLPFVADPVRVSGEVRRGDGWLRLRLATGGIERLSA